MMQEQPPFFLLLPQILLEETGCMLFLFFLGGGPMRGRKFGKQTHLFFVPRPAPDVMARGVVLFFFFSSFLQKQQGKFPSPPSPLFFFPFPKILMKIGTEPPPPSPFFFLPFPSFQFSAHGHRPQVVHAASFFFSPSPWPVLSC